MKTEKYDIDERMNVGNTNDTDRMEDFDTTVNADMMEDLGLITDVLNQERISLTDEDIEQRLANFHRMHDCEDLPAASSKAALYGRFVKIGLSIAAAIVLVFILAKFFDKPSTSLELQLAENGVVAHSADDTAEGTRYIPTSQAGDTEEQQVESKDLEKLFTATDTIKLNVSNGHSCKVVLPDGSCAYLHPNTRLVYPKKFDGDERRVRLEGEAYFMIQKDKKHPFIVSTETSETLVTGTEFNVNTDHATVKVTLVNGSVQFSNKQSKQRVFLMPGEEATLRGNSHIQVCEADTMKYVSWRDGYFYFDNTSLEDILRQISQSYAIQTVCSDAKLTHYRMHFLLRRDLDIEEVVDRLNKMKKVKVSLRHGKLYVEER